jgi:tripartite-type tricarboxylate transporter receptor subunit TctC
VKKLTEDFQAALGNAEVKGKLTDAGFEVVASDGPALDRFAREQFERWSEFVKRTGLKVEE